MKISKISITHEEVVQAVKEWLGRQGFDVPVVDVRRDYSWSDYEVEIKLPEPKSEPEPVVPSIQCPPLDAGA